MSDCDLETARRLLQAIRDEPRCDDPNCCPPQKEQPVTNPYVAFKAAIWIYAIAVMVLLCVLVSGVLTR